jgi:hypothetical protein
MSLLMFLHDQDRFRIMTDTYATTVEGEPFSFVDKCFNFPSRDMVVASTGTANLVIEWVALLRDRMVALDHTQIDAHAPALLRDIWEGITRETSGNPGTATIYHFGFDFHTTEAIRYTYRSTANFESERMTEPGFGIKPQPEGPFEAPDTDDEWLQLAQQVRDEQDAKPLADRINIGGDLMMTTLVPNAILVQRAMRFDDHGEHWNSANERLVTS